MATVTTTTDGQPSGLARWTPSLSNNFISMLNPFASNDADASGRSGSKANAERDSSAQKASRPILTAVTVNGPPPSPTRSTGSIMFAEPDTRSTSEAGSREGSVDGNKRTKKSSKPKTSYSVCHAPPTSTTRQKLHRRPRSLLQLHRLSARARPLPAFEVIPSANFSVRLTRAITKVFRAKHGLCPNDLVILKAEKYTGEEDEEEQEVRDVIGLICKGRKDEEKTLGNKMKIHMASGKEWEAYTTSNGGYEFFSTDEHGLAMTLRWVPKRSKDGSKATMKDGSRRFNFSTISPNTRRHPVIATLSKTDLEVYDSYKIPDANYTTPLSTPRQTNTILADVMEDETGMSPDSCVTDESLREIITVTAIWVTLKEGWSPSFKYDEKETLSGTLSGSPSKSAISDLATPPGSPLVLPMEKRASIKSIGSGIVRRASLLSKGTTNGNRASIVSTEDNIETQSPSRSTSISRTGRARADSSSTVLVHRAASNRRNNNHQATWRPDLLSSEIQEASREDLSTREGRETPVRSSSPLVNGKGTPHRRIASDSAAKAFFAKKETVPAPSPQAPVQEDTDVDDNDADSTTSSETEADGESAAVHSVAPASKISHDSKADTGSTKKKWGSRKGGRGWRRLLCGGSSHDV